MNVANGIRTKRRLDNVEDKTMDMEVEHGGARNKIQKTKGMDDEAQSVVMVGFGGQLHQAS